MTWLGQHLPSFPDTIPGRAEELEQPGVWEVTPATGGLWGPFHPTPFCDPVNLHPEFLFSPQMEGREELAGQTFPSLSLSLHLCPGWMQPLPKCWAQLGVTRTRPWREEVAVSHPRAAIAVGARCLEAFGHRGLCREEGIIRTFVQRQRRSCRCSTWIRFKSECRQLGRHSHIPNPGLA